MSETVSQAEVALPVQGSRYDADVTDCFRWRDAPQALPIIERAAELIGSKGYGQTSVRMIADESGFSAALVYYYFRNKEELLFAIIERGLRGVLEYVDEKIAEAGTPQEKLLALVTGSLKYHIDNFKQFVVSFKESNNLTGPYAKIAQLWRSRYVELVGGIINEYVRSTVVGMDRVTLKRDEWLERHVYYLIGLISWTAMNRCRIQSTGAESLTPEFLGQELCRLYINGMVSETRQFIARGS